MPHDEHGADADTEVIDAHEDEFDDDDFDYEPGSALRAWLIVGGAALLALVGLGVADWKVWGGPVTWQAVERCTDSLEQSSEDGHLLIKYEDAWQAEAECRHAHDEGKLGLGGGMPDSWWAEKYEVEDPEAFGYQPPLTLAQIYEMRTFQEASGEFFPEGAAGGEDIDPFFSEGDLEGLGGEGDALPELDAGLTDAELAELGLTDEEIAQLEQDFAELEQGADPKAGDG